MLLLNYLVVMCLFTTVDRVFAGGSTIAGRGGVKQQQRMSRHPSRAARIDDQIPPSGTRDNVHDGREVLSAARVWAWREAARDAVSHAFDSYMQHAYPADELRPLTCNGRRWDARERGTLDDALGGFSLTLVDSLDTLAVTGDLQGFRCGLSRVVADVRLDRDVLVSVFETSIRVLGGLISAHMLASSPVLRIFDAELQCARLPPAINVTHDCATAMCGGGCDAVTCVTVYSGELLSMAIELGTRLLPAFDTPSGIPYHRINLATGAVDTTSRETCTAAAGTYVLEFGALSRLSGLPVFEVVARRAVAALTARRSPTTGLIGSGIDAVAAVWRAGHTGVGAGVDSYLEYLLKAAVALDDDDLFADWRASAAAIESHTVFSDVHLEVGLHEGRRAPRGAIVSALQAFWPGLEVLDGRIDAARAHLRPLLSLWAKYSALPEAYDVVGGAPVHFSRDAPLRPELAESIYHLYTATRDPALLSAAGALLDALNASSRVACGFASVADVTTGRLDDRMDSYVLAETFKYAFLTFDVALNHWGDGPPSHRAHVVRPPTVLQTHQLVESAGCSCTHNGTLSLRRWEHPVSTVGREPLSAASFVAASGVTATSEVLTGDAVAQTEERDVRFPHESGDKDSDRSMASLRNISEHGPTMWCYHACAALRLYPRAHPLAFVRRSAHLSNASSDTGGMAQHVDDRFASDIAIDDEAAAERLIAAFQHDAKTGLLASLPLREDATIFTTEGHVLLITHELRHRGTSNMDSVLERKVDLSAATHASVPASYVFTHGTLGRDDTSTLDASQSRRSRSLFAAAAAASANAVSAASPTDASPEMYERVHSCLFADIVDALQWATHVKDPAGSIDLHPRGLQDFDSIVAPSIRAAMANAANGGSGSVIVAPVSADQSRTDGASSAAHAAVLNDVIERVAAAKRAATAGIATPRPLPSLHFAHRQRVRDALQRAASSYSDGVALDSLLVAKLPHLLPPTSRSSKLLVVVNTSDLMASLFRRTDDPAATARRGTTMVTSEYNEQSATVAGDDALSCTDEDTCDVPEIRESCAVERADGNGRADGVSVMATSSVAPPWLPLLPACFIASSWTGLAKPFPSAALAVALNAVPGATAVFKSVLMHCDGEAGSCAISTQLSGRPAPLVLHVHAARGVPLSRSLKLHAGRTAPAAVSTEHHVVDNPGLIFSGSSLAEAARRHTTLRHGTGHDTGSQSSDLFMPAVAASFGPTLTASGMTGMRIRLANPLNACSPSSPLPFRSDGAGVLVLVARGDCAFAAKARVLHASGAAAGVVVDFDAMRAFLANNASSAGHGHFNDATFVMADDGTGLEVAIPFAMLAPHDGAVLLNALRISNDSPVELADLIELRRDTLHDMRVKRRVDVCLFSSAEHMPEDDNVSGHREPELLPPASQLVLELLGEVIRSVNVAAEPKPIV